MDVLSVLFDRQGRIGRAEYWLGYAVIIAIGLTGWKVGTIVEETQSLPLALFSLALSVVNFWISICVMAKRYHDRGKSALWIMVAMIPIIGWIWSFIELGLLRGDEGTNAYGPDPASSKVAGEIEALRSQTGYGRANAVARTVAAAAVAAPQPRSPYTDGRPVFGKRV